MENTITIALTRQGTLRRQMDIIANNIANMNTNGYKAERMMFVEHLVRSRGGERVLGEKLAYVRDVASWRDTAEGGLESTGKPLDVAIQGDGFFAIETPVGERYTRSGRFTVNDAGQLVTSDGHGVLAEGGAPIFFSPADKNITIAGDGTISTENGPLGRLRVVRFESNQNMEMVAGGLLTTEDPPEDVAAPRVVQGMVEGSNVQGVVEMTRMIHVHRAYDGARRLIQGEHDRIRKMVEEYAR